MRNAAPPVFYGSLLQRDPPAACKIAAQEHDVPKIEYAVAVNVAVLVVDFNAPAACKTAQHIRHIQQRDLPVTVRITRRVQEDSQRKGSSRQGCEDEAYDG